MNYTSFLGIKFSKIKITNIHSETALKPKKEGGLYSLHKRT